MSNRTLLSVTNVYAGYTPGIDILQGLSLVANEHELTAVFGPNGAGKSTLLRTIFGFLHPASGTVELGNEDISTFSPHHLKEMGVSFFPQGISIFPYLTVEENLRVGAWTMRKNRRRVEDHIDEIYSMFPILKPLRRRQANALSGGQAKILSAAKELVTKPKVILVDEPTSGLAPSAAGMIYELLVAVQETWSCTVIMVDQNVEGAIALSDHVYLVSLGKVVAHGPSSELTLDRVREVMEQCLAG